MNFRAACNQNKGPDGYAFIGMSGEKVPDPLSVHARKWVHFHSDLTFLMVQPGCMRALGCRMALYNLRTGDDRGCALEN